MKPKIIEIKEINDVTSYVLLDKGKLEFLFVRLIYVVCLVFVLSIVLSIILQNPVYGVVAGIIHTIYLVTILNTETYCVNFNFMTGDQFLAKCKIHRNCNEKLFNLLKEYGLYDQKSKLDSTMETNSIVSSRDGICS